MLSSLQIGSQHFPNNLIQGPLAGVSCAPFRELTWRLSHPAYTCTEMISSKTLIHQPLFAQQRFVAKDPNEGPVCFQLSSNNPAELGEATKIATQHGADLIDLNCGCPVKKIRGKNSGSKLLSDARKIFQLITAMRSNTHVPVGIKIRIDGRSQDNHNQEVANAVSDAGADFLIVHGRHWSENYETTCHYDQIQFFVNAMKIPVIGNGDIQDVDSLKKMYATGCSGVMISRAGVGQPWLIKKLMAEMQNETFVMPEAKTIAVLFLEHTEKLAVLLNNEKFAVLQARKFAKYYARHLKHRHEFVVEMNQALSLQAVSTAVRRWFH